MGKNFSAAGSSKTFSDVGKKSAAIANVIGTLMIYDENLFDYPNNCESVDGIDDLVLSIRENGFRDSIEVTGFGMPEGKFMIVSGHRRRTAARKCGLNPIKCEILSFNSVNDLDNYVLMANSHRDSAKDPLLISKRYKKHADYLNAIAFEGNIREEVAKRLGISVQQADRYNAYDKVIDLIKGMVNKDIVGMSSVMPIAPLSDADQLIIYDMMNECVDARVGLTRDVVRFIVDGFKEGKTSYSELIRCLSNPEYVPHELNDSGLSLHTFTDANTQPGQSGNNSGGSSSYYNRTRNDEMHREFDPIAANADDVDRAQKEWEESQNNTVDDANEDNPEGKCRVCGCTDSHACVGGCYWVEDNLCSNCVSGNVETDPAKAAEYRAKKFIKLISDVSDTLGGSYQFSNDDVAADALRGIANTVIDIIDEMRLLSKNNNISDALEDAIDDIKKRLL
jgi:hypothetical protein